MHFVAKETPMKLILPFVLAVLASGCILVPVDSSGGSAGSGKSGGGTDVVCHKGKKTMELPQEAVRAHLDHGDSRGPC
jgi:hypothetical protein